MSGSIIRPIVVHYLEPDGFIADLPDPNRNFRPGLNNFLLPKEGQAAGRVVPDDRITKRAASGAVSGEAFVIRFEPDPGRLLADYSACGGGVFVFDSGQTIGQRAVLLHLWDFLEHFRRLYEVVYLTSKIFPRRPMICTCSVRPRDRIHQLRRVLPDRSSEEPAQQGPHQVAPPIGRDRRNLSLIRLPGGHHLLTRVQRARCPRNYQSPRRTARSATNGRVPAAAEADGTTSTRIHRNNRK
ncbi:conserved hypothetical protein [Culex quinquefasciatus]|uniref:Uncharacterized protein n=1 Tax=Culex quinquefasciatus TaxID=7176 RepID=B0XF32_CULQU|nr:conserved hypothetical protein [Culex quinquefasciatus]|eukprot:XP_001868254.1 conserved hypothetical protein [Culex quinquefasciatus]